MAVSGSWRVPGMGGRMWGHEGGKGTIRLGRVKWLVEWKGRAEYVVWER